jgi:hypothetical protein
MLHGISDDFLPLGFTDGTGPIIVAVEKAAIRFDPPGTTPESDEEWAVVADSIGESVAPSLNDILPYHDITRSTESGVTWRHLDLTAELLDQQGIVLRTQAHFMLRNWSWGGTRAGT